MIKNKFRVVLAGLSLGCSNGEETFLCILTI